MNEALVYQILQVIIDCGAVEFVVCAGSRNASFVDALSHDARLVTYYFPEERSAAYFALGRSRLHQRPIAIITTSGSAAAELLPAAMEAYYSGVPLIFITADRPRVFRGSGAPQAAEQVGLFGHYAPLCLDLSAGESCSLSAWNRRGPVHLNVCLDEPQSQPAFEGRQLLLGRALNFPPSAPFEPEKLDHFFQQVERPLVIVSSLNPGEQEAVAQFLLQLNSPVLLEGISGLREDPRLQFLSIRCTEQVLHNAQIAGYEIDGILRIGGVPTHRIWRDLESEKNRIKVCGLSPLPFSGLSWSRCVTESPIGAFLAQYQLPRSYHSLIAEHWMAAEKRYHRELQTLFEEEPNAEPSLMHALSELIPSHAHVYLGNSLPIREWDLAATVEQKNFQVRASRGINGIDGQISTFLGLCSPARENWALIGDLTALYDMAGLWVHRQLPSMHTTVVVINNGGGQIFSRMFKSRKMLNEHTLSFESLATMWNFAYQRLEKIPLGLSNERARFLEIVPDPESTKRFWQKFSKISRFSPACAEKQPQTV